MGTSTGKEGIKKNVQRSYICSVMAGHHFCSARAFAVNPSRLPARPSGLRGLTAQRGQAKGLPCHQCRTELARALSKIGREEMLIAKKLLDTPGPHISWIKNKRSWFVSRTRPRDRPQDNQLIAKNRVFSFKPCLRLEWRGQDGQNEIEQPDHLASLGDSVTSS